MINRGFFLLFDYPFLSRLLLFDFLNIHRKPFIYELFTLFIIGITYIPKIASLFLAYY